MMINKAEFLKELNNPEKRKYTISFLGMSGSRKTYWSNRLASKFHYKHVEFDELIGKSKEFTDTIKNISGKDEAEKLGKYFGKPWDKEFQSKENLYLSAERKYMSKKFPPGTILDLTGSAVYHQKQMREIAKSGLVIYFETNLKAQQEMFQIYLSYPKPVCWNGIFNKKENESDEEALARCYTLLLKQRAKLYEQYADVKISYESLKNIKNIEQFVEEVCKRLK